MIVRVMRWALVVFVCSLVVTGCGTAAPIDGAAWDDAKWDVAKWN